MLTIDRTKILGKGNYGIVYEGAWDGVKVAVKRIPVENAASSEREEIALQKFYHENVIKLFHVEEDIDFKCFALELCDASLDRLFLKENDHNKYSGPMPPEIDVLLQLAKGLEHIHQNELVHRDIKPENVLIRTDSTTQRVVMKWADFGLSKRVNERGTFTMTGVKGTLNWSAPEILIFLNEEDSIENEEQHRGTVKSDVFAEGLVFGYFLLGGVHPFGAIRDQIPMNIRTMEPTNLPKTEDIRNIIRKMLVKDPIERITSSDVVKLLENEEGGRVKKNPSYSLYPSQMLNLVSKGNSSLEDLRKLIQEDVDINAKDEKGLTPLLHFAENKSGSENMVEIISYLIEKGANFDALDSKGKNALLLWCENHRQHRKKSFFTIINIFIENGISITGKDKNGNNALTTVCRYYKNENLIDITRLFIENGIDINCKNGKGENALTLLCANYKNQNLIDIIRLFIKNGIDINCRTQFGNNAFTLLCANYANENLIDIIRLFIENGIDINFKNGYGKNALILLCANYKNENLIDAIQLFIANGIDINFRTQYGNSAFTLLCANYENENLIDIIRLLIENGIDVNCKNENGDNAITLSCATYKNGNLIDVLKLLMKSGFNLTKETRSYFQTNYHKKNRGEILQLLQQHPEEPTTIRMEFE